MLHLLKYLAFLIIRNRKVSVKKHLKDTDVVIDLDLDQFIDYWIFVDGTYEGEYIDYIRNNYKNSMFIDVGANIGIYSLSLSEKMKKIIAFEPSAANFKRLQTAVRNNNLVNIEIVNKAVGSTNMRQVKLYKNNNDHGSFSLNYNRDKKYTYADKISLDSFFKNRKLAKNSFIKIDVEGAEFEVLKGAVNIIRKYSPDFLVEMNAPLFAACGIDMKKIYDFLAERDYRSYILLRGVKERVYWDNLKDRYNNVLFIKPNGKKG